MVQTVLLSKRGFTIIEALVAMFIFSLVLIFMLQGFLLAYKINFEKLLKDETVKLAQEELEYIRNMDPDKVYDINGDGVFEDVTNRTDCPVCTTDPGIPECVIERQVRNVNVKFGKKVIVEQSPTNPNVYTVTVTICTDYKNNRTGDKIQYTVNTIIAKEE
ncbi:type IV pilus modification PilV family protein [Persephonella sp.]